ncbi:Hypothetical predicted protein [Olea europaea subsp. europaea]|uniref:Uncharacterized protein n=1 Tax=Olea europaea subsp. europaea TaxID=158383 RepID=A0A8S0S7Y7_OLEEU|nr:Hypothetical predicted protein [Olea europaea subsp. europaea]
MSVASSNPNMENRAEPRKCARWGPREHKIFMSTAEHVTAEGHHRGKRKKFGAREISESVDNLACASREIASAILAKEEGHMTLHECIDDLLSTGLVEAGDELHMFALWFLRSSENRVAYSAAKMPVMRYKWIAYYFERDKMLGSGSR